jgi:hypothetical protein
MQFFAVIHIVDSVFCIHTAQDKHESLKREHLSFELCFVMLVLLVKLVSY